MATVTWEPRPSFVYDVASARRSARDPEPSSVKFARQINEREITRWRLNWTAANRLEKFKLLKAYTDTHGGVLPMDVDRLENVSPTTVEVLFVPGTIRSQMISFERWNMSVEIEEVHD